MLHRPEAMPRDWQVVAATYLPVVLYSALCAKGCASPWAPSHRRMIG
jgi:hypothetical protein